MDRVHAAVLKPWRNFWTGTSTRSPSSACWRRACGGGGSGALHVEGDSPLRGGRLTGLHVSLAFEGEIEPWLQRRWGRPRETCLRFTRVGCGGAGILAGSCAVGRCQWLRQAHDGGSYRSRELHISF